MLVPFRSASASTHPPTWSVPTFTTPDRRCYEGSPETQTRKLAQFMIPKACPVQVEIGDLPLKVPGMFPMLSPVPFLHPDLAHPCDKRLCSWSTTSGWRHTWRKRTRRMCSCFRRTCLLSMLTATWRTRFSPWSFSSSTPSGRRGSQSSIPISARYHVCISDPAGKRPLKDDDREAVKVDAARESA